MKIQTSKKRIGKRDFRYWYSWTNRKSFDFFKKGKKVFWDNLTPSQKEEIRKADLEILNEETTDY